MSEQTCAPGSGKAVSRPGGRLGALLHTNVFSLRDVAGRLLGDVRFWTDTIDEAELPENVSAAIHGIVKNTRLWNHERIDVARELCSHAQDALEAGADPEKVAAGMGDARIVAKLIRRSMKRKRHWVWQARSWCVRMVGGVVVLLVFAVGFKAARLYIGKPSPTRNFIAEMNAPLAEYGEDERAWPLLQEACATFGPALERAEKAMQSRADQYVLDNDLQEDSEDRWAEPGTKLVPSIDKSHPDYPAVLDLYYEIQPGLELAKQAASKPIVGMLFSTKFSEDRDVGRFSLPDPIPDSADPAEQDWVISVTLPYLSPQRELSRWLAFDARLRAEAGDASGAIESIRAMLGFADQLDDDHFIISTLIGYAIEALAVEAVSVMLAEHGKIFSDDDLIGLAHMFGSPRFLKLPLDSEQLNFEDILQRTFTDNGKGNGYITNEGMEMLRGVRWFSEPSESDLSRTVATVRQMMLVAPRSEQLRVYDMILAQLGREEAAGYAIYHSNLMLFDAMVESLNQNRYYLAYIALPAYGSLPENKNTRRARIESCVAAIACELYRRENGAYPGTLEELVPQFLPSAPEDPFTGKSLLVSVVDGRAVIYAVGPDGDDDGGVMDGHELGFRPQVGGIYRHYRDPSQGGFIEGKPDGDWVLYPPPW